MTRSPARDSFRFWHRLRVRYNEADPQGIVFNGNYFIYFDVSFTEYMRAIGVDYLTLAAEGHDSVVAEAQIKYHAGARPDDWLRVGVRVAHMGRTSLIYAFLIEREADGAAIASGQIAYVSVDTKTLVSTPIPDKLRHAVLAYEGGQLTPPDAITPILDRAHGSG